MRTVLALVLSLALLGGGLLSGCDEARVEDPPVSIPTVDPELDAAARVGVQYVEAVRHHDAGAIYALAWSGMREKESRAQFLERTKFGGVSDARISGTIRLG